MNAITNQAAIYFDRNEAVITNIALNTIRDNPKPDPTFTFHSSCSNAFAYDFVYTGTTPGNATYFWDFGPDASPATSTLQNPTNIVFNSSGEKIVYLTVERFGCSETGGALVKVAKPACGKDNKKILVCHKQKQLLCISPSALPAHLAHGDCVGSCNFSSKQDDGENNTAVQLIEITFSVQPNPVNDRLLINFISPIDDNGKIELYNYLGQKINVVFNGFVSAGENHQIIVNTEKLPAGIYFTVLQTSRERRIIKVAKF